MPLNAAIFLSYFSCNPILSQTETIIMTIPMAIAEIAILIIGAGNTTL
jgi:hypothetical protein